MLPAPPPPTPFLDGMSVQRRITLPPVVCQWYPFVHLGKEAKWSKVFLSDETPSLCQKSKKSKRASREIAVFTLLFSICFPHYLEAWNRLRNNTIARLGNRPEDPKFDVLTSRLPRLYTMRRHITPWLLSLSLNTLIKLKQFQSIFSSSSVLFVFVVAADKISLFYIKTVFSTDTK